MIKSGIAVRIMQNMVIKPIKLFAESASHPAQSNLLWLNFYACLTVSQSKYILKYDWWKNVLNVISNELSGIIAVSTSDRSWCPESWHREISYNIIWHHLNIKHTREQWCHSKGPLIIPFKYSNIDWFSNQSASRIRWKSLDTKLWLSGDYSICCI